MILCIALFATLATSTPYEKKCWEFNDTFVPTVVNKCYKEPACYIKKMSDGGTELDIVPTSSTAHIVYPLGPNDPLYYIPKK